MPRPRRWALIRRLVPVDDDPDSTPMEAADKQLKAKVEHEQERLLVKLNQLETRSTGRT